MAVFYQVTLTYLTGMYIKSLPKVPSTHKSKHRDIRLSEVISHSELEEKHPFYGNSLFLEQPLLQDCPVNGIFYVL